MAEFDPSENTGTIPVQEKHQFDLGNLQHFMEANVDDFSVQNLCQTLWALSRHGAVIKTEAAAEAAAVAAAPAASPAAASVSEE